MCVHYSCVLKMHSLSIVLKVIPYGICLQSQKLFVCTLEQCRNGADFGNPDNKLSIFCTVKQACIFGGTEQNAIFHI